ncbi:MAG TPA: fibronectin type III domain-containing protein [Acidobacteriota bacterium]|nr:fibronectin type III domain-containing protein [Acidobacteriota bacterium]
MHFVKVIWAALLLSAWAGVSSPAQDRALPAPQFDLSGEELANAGFYSLSWSWPQELQEGREGLQFEVQQAAQADFSSPLVVYRGEDLGTSFSGKADGEFYYRLRIVSEDGNRAGPWSESYKVVVRHHPLSRALGLLTVGALVFLSAAAIILAGHYRQEVQAGHTR